MEYIIIFILVTVVLIGGIYLKNKLNITNDQLDFAQILLDAVDYISSKIDYTYSGSVSEIIEYVNYAIDTIQENEDVTDPAILKQKIQDETAKICVDMGIVVDVDLLKIIDSAIDYFIG
jgi:hypothetical protein